MKKPAILEFNGKQYTFLFNNRSLAMLERSIGRSILSILSGTGQHIMQAMTIDVTVAGIKYGLQELGDKDPYDVIDEICDAGKLLDDINGAIMEAWFNTGIFIKWAGAKETEAVPSKKKASK